MTRCCRCGEKRQIQSMHKIFIVCSLEFSFLCICDSRGDFLTLLAKIEPLKLLNEPSPSHLQ